MSKQGSSGSNAAKMDRMDPCLASRSDTIQTYSSYVGMPAISRAFGGGFKVSVSDSFLFQHVHDLQSRSSLRTLVSEQGASGSNMQNATPNCLHQHYSIHVAIPAISRRRFGGFKVSDGSCNRLCFCFFNGESQFQ